MSQLFSRLLVLLIVLAVASRYSCNNVTTNLLKINHSVHLNTIKQSLSHKTAQKSTTLVNVQHKTICLLLLCCGDIALNPGPTNNSFIKQFKPEVQALINKTVHIQKKFIDSMLHVTFLQKYQSENIPPPGLKLHKSPEIRNKEEISGKWQEILDETSMRLTESLIQTHQLNTSSLGDELYRLRTLILSKLSDHQQSLFTKWLQDIALRVRDKGKKRKLKKFNRHTRIFKQQQLQLQQQQQQDTEILHDTPQSINTDNNPSSRVHSTEDDDVTHSSPDNSSCNSTRSNGKRRNRRTHRNHTLKEYPSDNDDDIIVNLSDHTLSDAEKSVLKKGLKFVPTPTGLNRSELMADNRKFARRMRLKEFFADEESNPNRQRNKFKRSTWTPEFGRERTMDNYLMTVEQTLMNMKKQKVRSNLTSAEREAIQSLRSNDRIVIFPADKGGAVVIQNRTNYTEMAKEHLTSTTTDGEPVYQQLSSDCTDDIAKVVNHGIEEAVLNGVIDEDTSSYLKVKNPKAGNLYFLPKIHKKPGDPNPPGRPICNSKGTPTENISQWVDDQLAPLVHELPSYLQDDNDFLRKIQTINETHTLPPDTILATWDVKSLYTSIPTEGGVSACRKKLEASGKSSVVINVITKFINLILRYNIFRFANGFFLQKVGTAMGTRMAPNYANLFMGDLEEEILENYPLKPLVWYRYIDDIFFIWTHGREELDKFLQYANNNRHGMVFETTDDSVSNVQVPFLDVLVILKDGTLHTDLYTKPTDKFQYLNFKSCHPLHQKSNLPYALALRIRRICSDQTNFTQHCRTLTQHLRMRGYKLGLIKEGIRKAAALTREEVLKPKESNDKDEDDRVIFSTTYNPIVPDLKRKFSELHPALMSSERCMSIFPNPPLVAYRRNRNLNDMLVSRRLPPDNDIIAAPTITFDKNCNTCEECGRVFDTARGKQIHVTRTHNKRNKRTTDPGFHKCGDKRCNTCKLGTFTNQINITQTSHTFTIKQNINCKSTNVIYCVTCKKCQAQYIGETEQEIHARQRGHLADVRNNNPGLPYVKHFRECGGDHYTITGVEKLRDRDPHLRKAREKYFKRLFDVQIK